MYGCIIFDTFGRMAAKDTQEIVASVKPKADERAPWVLVTGATGYIATHVVQQLLSTNNYRVRGTVRSLKNEEKVKSLRELVPDAKYPLDLCEADLENKESWPAAVQDCKYVFHVASPFPSAVPKHADDLIRPAVQGTTNVLSACAESSTVKKVVLTSSIAAISCGLSGHPNRLGHAYSEEDWSPETACLPYEQSKLLAERAAWEFVKELPDEKKFDLSVMNPAFVQGPVLTSSIGTSVDIVKRLLTGDIPGSFNINFCMVDVRDVAQAHIIAMEKPECSGNRYILTSGTTLNFQEIAQILAEEFEPQGYKIGKRKIPKFVAWLGSFFSSEFKMLLPMIGKNVELVNTKMINELGIQPQQAQKTILDTAYSLIERGLVEKKSKYGSTGQHQI